MPVYTVTLFKPQHKTNSSIRHSCKVFLNISWWMHTSLIKSYPWSLLCPIHLGTQAWGRPNAIWLLTYQCWVSLQIPNVLVQCFSTSGMCTTSGMWSGVCLYSWDLLQTPPPTVRPAMKHDKQQQESQLRKTSHQAIGQREQFGTHCKNKTTRVLVLFTNRWSW